MFSSHSVGSIENKQKKGVSTPMFHRLKISSSTRPPFFIFCYIPFLVKVLVGGDGSLALDVRTGSTLSVARHQYESKPFIRWLYYLEC